MTKTFICCVGLPASGKSTWAEQEVLSHPAGRAVRINRDLIREMLHANRFGGRSTEGLTVKLRDISIVVMADGGAEVIISDDTNLDPKVQEHLKAVAGTLPNGPYQFVVKDFTDVPVEECIKRDLKRSRSVGAEVIRGMYNKHLAPKVEPIVHDPSLPMCVLVDMDGTLAHMTKRGPFEWSRVGEDELDPVVAELCSDVILRGDTLIVLSGRDSVCMPETTQWLFDHKIEYDDILMRPAGDMRKDSIVKEEIFREHIAGRYNVRYVIDDRNQVVEMWRGLGLKVLQVADGNF